VVSGARRGEGCAVVSGARRVRGTAWQQHGQQPRHRAVAVWRSGSGEGWAQLAAVAAVWELIREQRQRRRAMPLSLSLCDVMWTVGYCVDHAALDERRERRHAMGVGVMVTIDGGRAMAMGRPRPRATCLEMGLTLDAARDGAPAEQDQEPLGQQGGVSR